MPTAGSPITEEAEDILTVVLQAAATVDGNGSIAAVAGYAGSQVIEITNTGTGTATITIEGSFDQATWYAIGSMQIDNVTNPLRAVAALTIGATTWSHVYTLLDQYSYIRARQSASTASPAPQITATLRAYPV